MWQSVYFSSSSPALPSVSPRQLTRRPGTVSRATSIRGLLGGNNTDTGVNNIQYTAEFGNGVSASIGLDDPTVWDRTAVYNLGIPSRSAPTAPDQCLRRHILRHRRQDPGSIRPGVCSRCLPRPMRSADPTTRWGAGAVRRRFPKISGHPETKWGGSVMAALNIKNIPTGAGDDIKFDVSYAKGMTKNVIATSGTSPSFAMFGGSGFGYQSVGFGATTDGVYMPGAGGTGGIVLTSAWGIRGAFNHNWNPNWSEPLGSYSLSGMTAERRQSAGCRNHLCQGRLLRRIRGQPRRPDRKAGRYL